MLRAGETIRFNVRYLQQNRLDGAKITDRAIRAGTAHIPLCLQVFLVCPVNIQPDKLNTVSGTDFDTLTGFRRH